MNCSKNQRQSVADESGFIEEARTAAHHLTSGLPGNFSCPVRIIIDDHHTTVRQTSARRIPLLVVWGVQQDSRLGRGDGVLPVSTVCQLWHAFSCGGARHCIHPSLLLPASVSPQPRPLAAVVHVVGLPRHHRARGRCEGPNPITVVDRQNPNNYGTWGALLHPKGCMPCSTRSDTQIHSRNIIITA